MSNRQQGRYSGKPTGGRPAGLVGTNGKLALSQLARCETQPQLGNSSARYLWAPYARSFDAMARAATEDGLKLELVVGYRDFAEQVRMKKVWTARGKPKNAATPGHSTHGLGVTVDINRHRPGILKWLEKNAPRFGFDHPMWAGSAKGAEFGIEAWHWQGIDGWEPPAEVKVWVNGVLLPTVDAFRENNLIYGATRPIVEALDGAITGFRDGMVEADGKDTAAAWVPLSIRNGRGFSPIRELGKALGATVVWDGEAVRIG